MKYSVLPLIVKTWPLVFAKLVMADVVAAAALLVVVVTGFLDVVEVTSVVVPVAVPVDVVTAAVDVPRVHLSTRDYVHKCTATLTCPWNTL